MPQQQKYRGKKLQAIEQDSRQRLRVNFQHAKSVSVGEKPGEKVDGTSVTLAHQIQRIIRQNEIMNRLER